MPSDEAPGAQAHVLVERIAALLDESRALRLQLESAPQPNESASAEAERLLYFALASAIEAGLIRNDGGCADGPAPGEPAARADGRRVVGAAGSGTGRTPRVITPMSVYNVSSYPAGPPGAWRLR